MTPTEQIALIYQVGGTLFLVGFFLAFVTTGARVIWYVRHRGQALPPKVITVADTVEMPRLLVRDLIVKGGMFISFGLIVLIRFLPQEQRLAITSGNVAWALITTIPAVVAILTYDYFELTVIERATDAMLLKVAA